MNCIKCGKDTTEKNVFCQECLGQMDNYPVKPGTPVMIPQHDTVRRPPVRKIRAPEPEDVIRRQKKIIRLLSMGVAVLLIAWAVTTAVVIRMLMEEDGAPIGQNFGITTMDTGGT